MSCLPNKLRTTTSAQSQAHLQSACAEEEVGSPGAPGGTARGTRLLNSAVKNLHEQQGPSKINANKMKFIF